MNKKTTQTAMVGTSFILVIFIILSLVTFATISLVSSNADNNLSKSTADAVIMFYNGEVKAHETLQGIDKELANIYATNETEEEFEVGVLEYFEGVEIYQVEKKEEGIYLQYQTSISENEYLNSTLKINYPIMEEDGFYKISTWNTVSTAPWEPTTGIPVFQNK